MRRGAAWNGGSCKNTSRLLGSTFSAAWVAGNYLLVYNCCLGSLATTCYIHLRAAARLGHRHEGMFRACAEVRHGMASILCWADVMCQIFHVWGKVHETMQLPAQGQLRPLDASQLVRAAARLGHRHEAMFRACAEVRHGTAVLIPNFTSVRLQFHCCLGRRQPLACI
jgi:hypothetical protein